MKRIHLNNINHFIVISDVHLRNSHDSITRLFIKEINKIQNVDAVFLLGDIFDFIAAPVPFFLNYWQETFEALKNLKERNIQVYFSEGNHDFGFEHFSHPRFVECFTKCGDFEITLIHEKYGNILLKHGDEVVCKGTYRPFRHIVKSKWFQKSTTGIFSGSWMHSIFSRYAKLSRKIDNYRTLSIVLMNKKIQNFLHKAHSDCDVYIMGHIHKDVDHLVHTTKPVRVLIGKSWFDTPNLLEVNEKEICRYTLK